MTNAKTPETVYCEACGSKKQEPFLKITWQKDGDNDRFVQCPDCGLVYISPRTMKDYVEESIGEYFNVTKDLSGFVYMYRMISRWAAPPGKFLDIGCGPGYMLDVARGNGWNVTGIEPRKAFAEIGNVYLKVNIKVGITSTVDVPRKHFDVVSMTEVIEHVPSPLALLEEAKSFLKERGRLFLTTPNIASVGFKEKGENWRPQICPEEHLYYFSPDTLTTILRRAGLEPLEIITDGVTHPDEQILAVVARSEEAESVRKEAEVIRAGGIKANRYGRLKKHWFFGPIVKLGDHIVNYPVEGRKSSGLRKK